MRQKLRNLKNGLKNNKTIVGNIFSLGTLQIFNYIIPLITLPYVLRILGPEKYGTIAFMGAFVGYFLIIVNYGFNLTATKDISINRDDNKKVSEIFWNVIFIKTILASLSFIVALIIVFSFEKFSKEFVIFLFSFLMIIGEILFPVWMFQGMEKMKYITIINVIVKSLYLLPIFIFIKTVDDYYLMPLISSLSFITTGLIAFIMSIKVFKIQFVLPSIESIKYNLVEGWHVFVSVLSYGIYASSTIFILGLFTNNTIVGYYASADKILQAVKGFVGIFTQSLYPTVSKKLSESKEKAIKYLQSITKILTLMSIVVGIIIFSLSGIIINIIMGNEFYETITILRILSLTLLINGFSESSGILALLNLGYKTEFQKIMIYRTMFFLVFGTLLCYLFGVIGLSVGYLTSELFIGGLLFLVLRKKGINLLKF